MKLQSASGDDEVAISLTPLIDVVFILLIFFMLASSFLDWEQVPVQGQALGKTASQAVSDIQVLVVEIDRDGQMQSAGRGLTESELPGMLGAGEDSGLDRRVLVKVADGVPLQRTMDVLELLRKAGAGDISLVK